MKKISTLLVAFFLTLSLFAADGYRSGMLTIRSFDNADMKVVIDGRRFEPSQNMMTVRNIDAGYHYVKIYKAMRTGFFTIYNTRYQMVFNGNVAVRPKTSLTLTIDRFGRTSITENRLFGGWDDRRWNDDRNRGWDDNRGYNNNDDCNYDFDNGRNLGDYSDRDRNWDNRNYNDRDYNNRGNDNRGGNYDNRNYEDRNNRGYDNGDVNNRGGNYDNRSNRGGYDVSKAMSDNDFSLLLDNISKERFESNMMKSATQVISTSYFTTAQVKQLLQLFTFESNKLELAKKAYEKTVDQRNYYLINDVFNFSSSKDELNRYITQR